MVIPLKIYLVEGFFVISLGQYNNSKDLLTHLESNGIQNHRDFFEYLNPIEENTCRKSKFTSFVGQDSFSQK